MHSYNTDVFSNKDLFAPVFFKNVFTDEECKQIINSKDCTEETIAGIGDNVLNDAIRQTKIKYLNLSEDNLWIGKKIIPIIEGINNSRFKFKITRLKELHLLEYSENCFYKWHMDLNSRTQGAMRKLSFVAFLTDPNDYEGGEIIFELNDIENSKNYDMSKGSIIIFPSFLAHRVSPVKKGIRHTLVGWVHGPAFQ
ncbi:MAG: 2OG-Fe(II) oxygenase [Candidatus Sericytochromatia bacterium]